mmetsp:Transcript_58350/g.143141  ORF Transcript_58350/g.143141 Transcript_58350/m.143141 type:complete len:225 (+) Transcript_58350:117-791(+)|eukprot:CAMPEP_0206245130 /NCGR_PEP_ID=MMETSP0047_2-20121206/18530_1 /ASSEMBLY_ACC=CAM_ASM_000192 /TAXON_ID=195065 /ORGANISM="Chroomonas mesostigmatica_cf, Strain CCMP1168" /LENGTH=224 /DNA_ID=CAMNT_0053670403 /DNA_START=110 /DNA_END=784 /DNA_ORIENTATION=-
MAHNKWKEDWDDTWNQEREIEQKKQEVLVKASQNSEKIRQMVRETEQTRQIGAETLTVLDQQTEQLKRIHGDVDKIEENLNFADRTIRGMESIWGSVRNMVARPVSAVKTSVTESIKLDKATARTPAGAAAQRAPVPAAASRPAAAAQQKTYGEDWQGKLHKLEDEQDKDLDTLSGLVGQLKSMGTDMGVALKGQTQSIERLSDRTDTVDARLAKTNLKVKRML